MHPIPDDSKQRLLQVFRDARDISGLSLVGNILKEQSDLATSTGNDIIANALKYIEKPIIFSTQPKASKTRRANIAKLIINHYEVAYKLWSQDTANAGKKKQQFTDEVEQAINNSPVKVECSAEITALSCNSTEETVAYINEKKPLYIEIAEALIAKHPEGLGQQMKHASGMGNNVYLFDQVVFKQRVQGGAEEWMDAPKRLCERWQALYPDRASEVGFTETIGAMPRFDTSGLANAAKIKEALIDAAMKGYLMIDPLKENILMQNNQPFIVDLGKVMKLDDPKDQAWIQDYLKTPEMMVAEFMTAEIEGQQESPSAPGQDGRASSPTSVSGPLPGSPDAAFYSCQEKKELLMLNATLLECDRTVVQPTREQLQDSNFLQTKAQEFFQHSKIKKGLDGVWAAAKDGHNRAVYNKQSEIWQCLRDLCPGQYLLTSAATEERPSGSTTLLSTVTSPSSPSPPPPPPPRPGG